MWNNELRETWSITPTPRQSVIENTTNASCCVTYSFIVKRTGTLQVNVTSLSNTVSVFVSNNFVFDSETGEPETYIASGTSGSTISCSVTQGTRYYVLIKGITSGTNYTTTYFRLVNCKFSSGLLSSITGLYGQKTIKNLNNAYCTSIYSITFAKNYTVWVKSGAFGLTKIYASTTQDAINETTGYPDGTNLLTMTTEDPESLTTGYMSATAGTTYYFYFAYGFPMYYATGTPVPWECTLYCQADETLETTNIWMSPEYNSTVMGSYGISARYPDDTSPVAQQYMVPGHAEEYYWIPGGFPCTDYSGNTCEWGKITNILPKDTVMVEDYNYTYGGSKYYKITGYVSPQSADFSWTHTPTSGGAFQLTASEWNDFVCYCTCKANITDGCKSCIKLGDLLTAESFNRIKNGLNMTDIPDVSTGDIIYASYLNDMLTKARSL